MPEESYVWLPKPDLLTYEELTRFAAMIAGPSAAEDVVSSAVVRVFSSPRWPTASRIRRSPSR